METGNNIANFLAALVRVCPINSVHIEYRKVQRKKEGKVNLRKKANTKEYPWMRRSITPTIGVNDNLTTLLQFLRSAAVEIRKLEIVTAPVAISRATSSNICVFGVPVSIFYVGQCSLPEAMFVFTPGKIAHYSELSVGYLDIKEEKNDKDKEEIQLIKNIFNGESLPF